MMRFLALALAILPALVTSQNVSTCPQASLDYSAPLVASGLQYTKLVSGLKHPRQILVDGSNNLLVASTGDGLLAFPLITNGSCVSTGPSKVLVADPTGNFTHAILLSPEGKTLFASTPDSVLAWDYDSSNASVTSQAKTLVSGMALPGSLSVTRALAIPSAANNTLLVFRGSWNDSDFDAIYPTTARSLIKKFDLTNVTDEAYDFVSNGSVFHYGVRDSTSFVEDSQGIFWGVDNGADAILRNNQSIGLQNPADELNKLGWVTDAPRSYGFPLCHQVWNSSELVNATSLSIGDTFSLNTNSYSDARCNSETQSAVLSLVPHSAPLGLLFYNPLTASLGDSYRQGAFIAYHGPTGHKVVYIPFKDGEPTGEQPVDFLYSPPSTNTTQCRSELIPDAPACLSPVGLAYDSQGRLFVSSDQSGEVFVVTRGN